MRFFFVGNRILNLRKCRVKGGIPLRELRQIRVIIHIDCGKE